MQNLIFWIFSCIICSTLGIENAKRFGESVAEIGNTLELLLTESSGLQQLTDAYEAKQNDLQFATVDGNEIASDLSNDLEEILAKKMKALTASVEFAEDIAKQHEWTPKLTLPGVKDEYFHDAKEIDDTVEGYEYSPQFKQRVNANISGVHIPVEIWEGDIDILNGLKWSDRLDEIWRQNKEADPDLLWQYFGTQTGIMRIYPASKWRSKGDVDLYDVRRRPWYTQGASSPKNMFILMDTSGSTFGQALALMKQSVKSLIDTLGENDFINVAKFAAEAKLVSCFDDFVQATHWNKVVIKEMVDQVTAEFMANYEVGFEYAFQQFKKFNETESESNEGANCNRVIMFLTDGGSEHAKKIFEKYNKEKRVRVFSYAVGPTANPINGPQWISCANKGYFCKIPAMGAIRSAVQGYYGALSNGLVAGQAQDFAVTHSYEDHMGLGMMTTVTLPVYNRTEQSNNQTILGVMGSDVTVQEMVDLIPKEKLGAGGYAFAINSNGYIVFHPNLQAAKGYVENPPNVDLLDVEAPSEDKEQLRRDMIDSKTGEKSISGIRILSDGYHVDVITRNYFYTPIKGSTFSLGVVLPSGAEKYIKQFPDISPEQAVDVLTADVTETLVASWISVDTSPEAVVDEVERADNDTIEDNETTDMQQLIEDVQNVTDDTLDDRIFKHLFFDALITQDMDGVWPGLLEKHDVMGMFVATEGGLTRVYPLDLRDVFEGMKNTVEEVFYQRSLDAETWIYSVIEGFHNNSSPVVMATKAVKLSSESYKLAVVGVLLSQDQLRSFVVEQTPECQEQNAQCFLLDDAGFVVMLPTNDTDYEVGQEFESVDNAAFNTLWQNDVFLQNEQYDYQGICRIIEDDGSFAIRSAVPPFIFELLSVNWWSSKVAWAYLNFNLVNWIGDIMTSVKLMAFAQDIMTEAEDSDRNESCINHLAQYSLSDLPDNNIQLQVQCDNCTRSVTAVRLAKSNLLLVHLEDSCPNAGCLETPVIRKPVKQDNSSVVELQCNATSRYRLRPNGCYDFNEDEKFGDCGGAASTLFSAPLFLGLLLFTFVRLFDNGST